MIASLVFLLVDVPYFIVFREYPGEEEDKS